MAKQRVKQTMKRKKNPYADLPVTWQRVFYMALSAVWYLLQLSSAVILGFILFGSGKKNERKRSFFHHYMWYLYRLDMRLMPGVKHRIYNPYKEEFNRGAIIVCNHQSFLDSVYMIVLSPRILIVTNDNVWKNKFIHRILGFADFFPISRGIENSVSFFREYVNMGYSVAIFPEGERSDNCSVLRFHRGAFYLAEQLGADILPVFLHGTGYVMPKGCNWINKGRILIEIGQRIPPGSSNTYPERTRRIGQYYRQHYEELCLSVETASYFHAFVVELYGYTGIRMQRKVGTLLKRYADFSAWVDAACVRGTVLVLHDAWGVIGMLFALVHPDKQVVSTGNEWFVRTLAVKCNSLPDNLILLSGSTPEAAQLRESILVIFRPTAEDRITYRIYDPVIIE